MKMNAKPTRLDCISRTVISNSRCKSKEEENNRWFKDHESLTCILFLDQDVFSEVLYETRIKEVQDGNNSFEWKIKKKLNPDMSLRF